ncbi:MAG: hypothetical protein IJA53_01580 [Spirochaetaceae bacterium]|nr:hypothetical protein [Spirochaetaceae bacterium]
MISQDAKTFLLQANQLQENFSRLITVNNLLKEAKIDLSALDKRLGRYDNYFDKMLETAPIDQDWNFILKQLEDNVNELNTYFGWINDVERYDIQITEQELQRMIQYRNTIRNQIQQIRNYPL